MRRNHTPVEIGYRQRNRSRVPKLHEGFFAPEQWHAPREEGRKPRFVVEPAGPGYRHPVTVDEIRERIALLPEHFLTSLEVIQLSRMTRKRHHFPCYGMQWGYSVYLYPIQEDWIEVYHHQPVPSREIEARMYGGRWVHVKKNTWHLVWDERTIKDYYLNNILIHEIGHLVDDRNSNPKDRERYAEWFAIEYGFRADRGRGRFSKRKSRTS